MKPVAGIFRLQLFKPSEVFIPLQVDPMSRYDPLYIGRTVHGDPKGAAVAMPAVASGMVAKLAQTFGRVGLRNMSGYLDVLSGKSLSVLHAHFAIDAVYAMRLASNLNVPLVTTLHGFDVTRSDKAMLTSKVPAWINGVLFRKQLQDRGEVFLCVSEFIRQAALQKGFPEDKLRVHYIGIDTNRFPPRSGAGEDGLIVHVARLVEKKGTRYLLQALARIAPDFPQAKLVIIGDGPMRGELEQLTRDLNLGDRVQFLGMLPNDEVLAWDRRAAVKAVPSVTGADGDQEGLPTVITETYAQGVPVVGFTSGGIAEAVLHEKTGLLSPEKDVEGLAKHLALLLGNSDLRARFGQAGRARVEAEFDVRRQTAKLEDIYDDLRGARP